MSIDPETGLHRRGTSNGNAAGSSEDRRRRKAWLVETYRADVDLKETAFMTFATPLGEGTPACRCYRCGTLLTVETVTVDRIIPGALGGTYARNNIRPACAPCNTHTGAKLGASRRKKACPSCGGRSRYRRRINGHPCMDERHPS